MDSNKLLQTEVQDWIQANKHQNIYDLALKKSPFKDIGMNELVQQIQGWQVSSHKFQTLFGKPNILFPPKLNLEQTSSEATAQYKNSVIRGNEIVDITGGFGIDTLFFSNTFKKVHHIEQNTELQYIAQYNFKTLNKENIFSYCADGIEFLKQHKELKDILFIDPARRDSNKKKVFLLEDLTPNILDYLDIWCERFNEIWIKLSPMIDIQYLIKTIPNISNIHLVAVKNELKEVLIQIKKVEDKNIIMVNLETDEPICEISWIKDTPSLFYSEIQNYIYEPNVAIQKSGYNDFLTEKFSFKKLAPNTQLFTSNELIKDFPGRVFKVNSIVKNPKKELKGKSIQAIHRNFPENLSVLQKKFKFKTDGTSPIIFTRTEEKAIILSAELMKF